MSGASARWRILVVARTLQGGSELRRRPLPKLFRKWLKASRPCVFGAKSWLRGLDRPPLGGLRSPDSGHIPIPQTVSPRTPVNKDEEGPDAARFTSDICVVRT